jgi:Na+-translocating ferredoxin:NAD+ oxidoreductase subunit A
MQKNLCGKGNKVKFSMILQIAIGAILVNNIILVRMLGLCPLTCVSKKINSAFGMGLTVTIVMTVASAMAWLIDNFLLIPYNIAHLRLVIFILAIASTVQFTGIMIQKFSSTLHDKAGAYLPLVTSNCAILAIALISVDKNPYTGVTFTLSEALLYGFMSGIGFMMVILIMAGIMEKISNGRQVWKPLEGLPLALITAGLIALAFSGFNGLHFSSAAGGF